MRVNAVCHGRSGSQSIVNFFSKFKVSSYHEEAPFVFDAHHWGQHNPPIDAYDLDFPPEWVRAYLEKFDPDMWEPNWFHADWSKGLVMYPMSLKWPDIIWVILLRDGVSSSASFWYHLGKPKKFTFEGFVNRWVAHYEFMLAQIEKMEKKPWVLEFDKMIRGDYNEWMLNLYKVERTDGNLGKAKTHWEKKVGSHGDYVIPCHSAGLREKVTDVYQRVLRACVEVC